MGSELKSIPGMGAVDDPEMAKDGVTMSPKDMEGLGAEPEVD